MQTIQKVFMRHEKKYILTRSDCQAFLADLEPYCRRDQYGKYTISSIYYDTDDYRIIRASLSKPVYKEKLRLRSYGIAGMEEIVFLELKKKYDGTVYKRRISLPHRQALDYLEAGNPPDRRDQIFQEVDWFVRRYQPGPKILLIYDRAALSGIADSGLRITFDQNIRWRDYDLDLSRGLYGESLLEPDKVLMEIKTGAAMPFWLADLLTRHQLFSGSFSKYGTCYQSCLLQKGGHRYAG